MLLNDGFTVLDASGPDVDSKLGGKRQRLVRRERRPRSATSRASACRALHQRPLGQYGWCLRSVRRPFDDGALGSFHDSQARHAVSAVGRAVPAGARHAGRAARAAPRHPKPIEGGSVRDALRTTPDAAGEWRRRGLCCALGCTRSARSRRRARSSTVSSTASASRCAALGAARLAPQRLAAQRDRVLHARPGLLRARLVAAAALRERLSRRQRAVCRLLRVSGAGARNTRARSALSGNYSSDAAECVGEQRQQRKRRRPAGCAAARRHVVDERHAHDYQLKANLS